jgi:protein gp37
MGVQTGIGYCDSTLNLMMGCNGCELWNLAQGIRICYAGNITAAFAGKPGWPADFSEPAIFPERIGDAQRWRDLSATDRPSKPWLNGLPRVIFLNDMGDTFTKSLPAGWFAEFVPNLAATPHVYILLTKRASKMAEFWKNYGPPPRNFWLLVSVTSQETAARLDSLLSIEGAAVRGVSYEPAHGPLPASALRHLDWVIFGGESIQDEAITTPCDLDWAIRSLAACREAGVPFFMKQIGSHAMLHGKQIPTRDLKGEDWDEFPSRLRFREMPHWRKPQGSLFDAAQTRAA